MMFSATGRFQGKNRRRRKCVRWSEKKNSGRNRFGRGGWQRVGEKRICRFRSGERQNQKSVTYFLASAKNDEIKLKVTGGLDDAKWFKMKELPELKIYDDIRGILTEAIKELNKK